MISGVRKVIVPVADQQAALEFWTTGMGFELVRDDAYGDERWIEVRPPDQELLLVLSPRQADEPRRTVPDRLPHSDLFFDCADIESTHAELGARGVKFALPPARQHSGWWALFEDNEGTRYALGQWENDRPGFDRESDGSSSAEKSSSPAGTLQEESQETPTPHPALRKLSFLVGSWHIEGETVPDFPGAAMRSVSEETFEWLPGGFFLVHRWNSVFGDPAADAGPELPGGPIQKGIMFYGFDASTGKFRTHFFDGNGPFHEGSMYQGELCEDGRLVFTGPARFTITQNGDGTLTNDWELPGENATWVPWRHTVLHRLEGVTGPPLWFTRAEAPNPRKLKRPPPNAGRLPTGLQENRLTYEEADTHDPHNSPAR
jgi:lactoylglutathione lyase